MKEREKWTNHTFKLGIDIGWTANVLSRIEDSALRIKSCCAQLSDAKLSLSNNGEWSIKQHVGHLIDLEELHQFRLRQFQSFPEVLKAADMSNQQTDMANHNDRTIGELTNEFDQKRKAIIQEYLELEDKVQQHQALHPRIKELMRPVDLMFFFAEHDDHHIASIKELKGEL